MTRTSTVNLAALTTAFLIAACSVAEESGESAEAADQPAAAAGTNQAEPGVIRETAPPERPAVTVIDSKPGPDGTQIDLIESRVVGDILTLTFQCSSNERNQHESFRVEAISVIDEATSQRIGVLQDDAGNWLTSDSSASSSTITVNCGTQPGIFWAKFPAPPATSPAISVNLPDTAPFYTVPVQR